MPQEILNSKKEFSQKLEELSKLEAPAHFDNSNPLVVLYDKLIAIEKKLDEVKNP